MASPRSPGASTWPKFITGAGLTHWPTPELVKRAPRKFLAGILLARRRDVGVTQHPPRRDRVARLDAAAERGDGRDLALGEIGIAVVVARIGDFDADGARIDVGFAGPKCPAGVPGPTALRDQLDDATVFKDEIMAGDFAAARLEQFKSGIGVAHPGVMQHDHVDAPGVFALAVIGRGHHLSDYAGLRGKAVRDMDRTLGQPVSPTS